MQLFLNEFLLASVRETNFLRRVPKEGFVLQISPWKHSLLFSTTQWPGSIRGSRIKASSVIMSLSNCSVTLLSWQMNLCQTSIRRNDLCLRFLCVYMLPLLIHVQSTHFLMLLRKSDDDRHDREGPSFSLLLSFQNGEILGHGYAKKNTLGCRCFRGWTPRGFIFI